MKNKQAQQTMIDTLDIMICHADKGASGFWIDDGEGCGNPAIFPEFEDGLKHGRLVQKEHYLCPWNTAVMYGSGHGNIHTGCYYSCSIKQAQYLSSQELKKVLCRFKDRLENGSYDDLDALTPLLTTREIDLIKKRIRAEQVREEQEEKQQKDDRLKKAAALIAKYPEEEACLALYYGENEFVRRKNGLIFFYPDSQKDVIGAKHLSYDEYLDVQFASLKQSSHSYRSGFARGFFSCLLGFKGQIEKINAKHVCFKRIFISGMYQDGSMFDAKEDHVWMDKSGFESFSVGDNVSFGAEVYRYIKTGNGKSIGYGLHHPMDIQKIEEYQLPSDNDILQKEIEQMICDLCFLGKYCNGAYCMMDQKRKRALRQQIFRMVKEEHSAEEEAK